MAVAITPSYHYMLTRTKKWVACHSPSDGKIYLYLPRLYSESGEEFDVFVDSIIEYGLLERACMEASLANVFSHDHCKVTLGGHCAPHIITRIMLRLLRSKNVDKRGYLREYLNAWRGVQG